MYDRITILLPTLLCVTAARPAQDDAEPEPLPPPTRVEEQRDMLDLQTDFALELHRKLVAADPEANAFASPLSVWTALSMLAEGARGETADELSRAMLCEGAELDVAALHELAATIREGLDAAGDAAEIAWADAMWMREGFPFDESVVRSIQRGYDAMLEDLSFGSDPDSARRRINAWVAEQTRGRIEDLLPAGSIPPTTTLVLTDAVYFKGTWAVTFDEESTAPVAFHLAGDGTVEVPFVRDDERTIPIAFLGPDGRPRDPRDEETSGTTVFELPYEGGNLSFVGILPAPGSSLAELEEGLDGEELERLIGELREERVRFEMPKLEMEPSYDLVPTLREMGVMRIFDAQRADLSGFVEGDVAADLYVSGAFHKAFLRVDEEGTEAAAATGIVVVTRAAQPAPLVRVDRPYLFLVRERSSGAILFLGRVMDPSA